MIKKFIDKLLGKTPRAATAAGAALEPVEPPEVVVEAMAAGHRVEVPKSEHGIDPALVDDHALRVVKTLADAGHEAYIVGGAVRDLLVGLRPRISTSPPTRRPSRSRRCSGAPSSSAGAFASCTWCSGAAASTR